MRLRRLIGAAVLAISIGAPIVEMFDQWDHTLQDGNDTEANVVVVALCVGLVIAVGTAVIVARLNGLAATSIAFVTTPLVQIFTAPSLASPIPEISPPIPLRI